MMRRSLVFGLVLLLISIDPIIAAKPNLKLPFPVGESWILTRAYDDGTHINSDFYALDFTLSGCNAWDKPIVAVAGGTVEVQTYDSDGYGNHILINHGDGYKSRYAHLKSISVINEQSVTQGQEIGRCGNTGFVLGTSCKDHPGVHIHVALYRNGQAEIMEPMSGYTGFENHVDESFLSDNTGIIYECQWKSQAPSGVANLFPGQAISFSVSYTNTGTTIWKNTQGNKEYIELRSCDSGGNVADSWLFPGSNLGWIDQRSVVTATTDDVGNGDTATFTFTGKVPVTAAQGLYNIYFRPHHFTGGYIENWGGMHFQINVVTGWLASTPKNDCVGPADAEGHRWSVPEFNAGSWTSVNLPDGNWGCENCDRYFRRSFEYSGAQNGTGVAVWFRTDDGCELYVNGLRVGGYGRGLCHVSGCVNGVGCFYNQPVPAVDITNYIHEGTNIIGMHVSNAGQGAVFDCVISAPPLALTTQGVCCQGSSCIPISEYFTCANCIASMGTVYTGKQYDCGQYSPCSEPESKVLGDPVLTFRTSVPVPTLPATLSFTLLDSLPHTAWYVLPADLGGDTLYVDSIVGQFSVQGQASSHPDTVDLHIMSYTFSAPSLLFNGISTGPHTVSLDTSVVVSRHGTYCRSTRQVDLVIPALVTNNIYSASNPIHSQSYVIGNFNEATGILTTASTSIDVLSACCIGIRGNVKWDVNQTVNVVDLTSLVRYLFGGSAPPLCKEEADVNGNGSMNIVDITYLVSYLFRGGLAPVACP
jgi:Peptidase family M23/Dockerin type I domain